MSTSKFNLRKVDVDFQKSVPPTGDGHGKSLMKKKKIVNINGTFAFYPR